MLQIAASPELVKRIAVEADVDARTVMRFLLGFPSRPRIHARLNRALASVQAALDPTAG